MSKRLRKEEKIGTLAGLPLFENCTRRELGDIASIMVEADRPAGTYLTREGQDGGLMFVLVEGRADVLASGGNGGPRVIGRLQPGDVVGELSLIDGQTRSATVRAATDVKLLELNYDDFVKLIHRSPKFVRNLLRALSLRVREMEDLSS
jgi:CRP/FNR family transcriptional regulator/CRP/FNR family cyclic AMP-dependent transcriptional regulator